MNKNSRYFIEAKYLASEKYSGVDGFNNMSSGFRYADGGQGAAVERFSPQESAPYEFEVANANTTATSVTMFNSFRARTASNFNNVSGITITSSIDGVNYGDLLASTEVKPFECGMTYIQVVTGSNSAITATWSLITKNVDGNFETKTFSPKKSVMQQQADVLEFNRVFKIDGFTALTLTVPASTTVKYSFYPSATAAIGRVLGNVPVMLDYGKPTITPATQMELSPAAIQAIRG